MSESRLSVFRFLRQFIAAQGYAMGKFWFVIVEVLLGDFCDDVAGSGCRRMELKLSEPENFIKCYNYFKRSNYESHNF